MLFDKNHPLRSSGDGYDGSEVVPDDSFLRRLPSVLDRRQRMEAEALVYSADVIVAAWQSLQQLAVTAGKSDDADRNLRVLMLSKAWNIVDQINAARQLAGLMTQRADPGPGFNFDKFMFYAEPARQLRNKMDHLAGNVANLASQTGPVSALFGSLSFFVMESATRGTAIVIQAGSVGPNESWHVVNPAGRVMTLPADLFTLNAFGIIFELAPAIRALKDLLTSWTADWALQIEEQVELALTTTPYTREQLMQHPMGGVMMRLALDFSPKSE
jgi:hypothetical protein